MKALYIICAILASAMCGQGSVQAPAKGAMRIATYNVGVFSKGGFNSTDMVASMVKEMDASVVSLNELDSCNARHNEFQLREFARAMGGWDYSYAPAINYLGGTYGIGIASRPGLKIIRRFSLKLSRADGSEQRALAVCEFERFVLCSTHLDHMSKEAQSIQAREITAWIEKTYSRSRKPVFLCGDFNALPDSATIAFLKENWTVLSPSGSTYPADRPSKCIDYIMVYKNAADRVKVTGAQIPVEFNTGDVTVASDHLPVYVDVVF